MNRSRTSLASAADLRSRSASRASIDNTSRSPSPQPPAETDGLLPGAVVLHAASGLSAVVRFLGQTEFAPGVWAGIELAMPAGKNDGSVQGVRYFSCAQNHGLFVRPNGLSLVVPVAGINDSTYNLVNENESNRHPNPLLGEEEILSPQQMHAPLVSPTAPATASSLSIARTEASGRLSPTRTTSSRTQTVSAKESSDRRRRISSASTGSAAPTRNRTASTIKSTTTTSNAANNASASSRSPPRTKSRSATPTFLSVRTNKPSEKSTTNSTSSGRFSRLSGGPSSIPSIPRPPSSASSAYPPQRTTQTTSRRQTIATTSTSYTSASQRRSTSPSAPILGRSPSPTRSSRIPTPGPSSSSHASVSGIPSPSRTTTYANNSGIRPPSTSPQKRSTSPTLNRSVSPTNRNRISSPTHQRDRVVVDSKPPNVVENVHVGSHDVGASESNRQVYGGSTNVLAQQPSMSVLDDGVARIADESVPAMFGAMNDSMVDVGQASSSQPLSIQNKTVRRDHVVVSDRLTNDANSRELNRAETNKTSQSASLPHLPTRTDDSKTSQNEFHHLELEIRHLKEAHEQDRIKLDQYHNLESTMHDLESTMLSYKDKYDKCQSELRDLRTRVRDLVTDKTKTEQDLERMTESMELMLVDKEIAEEQVDVLKNEMKTCRDRIEELVLELDIAKTENELLVHGGSGAVRGASGSDQPRVNTMQLELQNERLREALMKLRDVSLSGERDLKDKIESMRSEVESSTRLRDEHDRVKNELNRALENIEDLKQHLDDALGSEELVQRLSDANMRLGERITEMRAAIDELEELRRINNELEQAHIDAQKSLVDEIAVKDAALAEVAKHMSVQREAIKDSEYTITQFRELVRKLQEDLRQRPVDAQSTVRGDAQLDSVRDDLAAQLRSATSMNMELRTAMNRARARLSEMELRQIEADQYAHEISILRQFVPDSFGATDGDVVQCFLALRRINLQAQMIGDHYNDLVRSHDRIETTQYAVYVDVSAACRSVCANTKRLYCALESADTDDMYNKFGRLVHRLTEIESPLKTVLQSVHANDVDGDESVMNHSRNLTMLLRIADCVVDHRTQLIGSDLELVRPFTRIRLLCDEAQETVQTMSNVRIDVEIMKQLLTAPLNSNHQTDMMIESGLSALLEIIPAQTQVCIDATETVLKNLNRLNSLKRVPKRNGSDRLMDAFKRVRGIALFVTRLRSRVRSLVLENRSKHVHIRVESVTAIVNAMADELRASALGGRDASKMDSVGVFVQFVQASVSALMEAVADTSIASDEPNNNLESFEKETDSDLDIWTRRSKTFKAKLVLGSDLQQRVADLDKQIALVVSELQVKKDQLGESAVQIDVLKRRLERAEKQSTSARDVEDELEKAKNDAQMYVHEIAELRRELEEIEIENCDLKNTVERLGRSTSGAHDHSGGLLSISNRESSSSRSEIPNHVLNDAESVSQQIESQRRAIRFLLAENCRLRSNAHLSKMADLLHPADPITKRILRANRLKHFPSPLIGNAQLPAEDESMRSSSPVPAQTKKDVLNELRQMAQNAIEDVRRHQLNARIVDLSAFDNKSGATTKWIPLQFDPEIQLIARRETCSQLAERVALVCDKLSNAVVAKDNHPLVVHLHAEAKRIAQQQTKSIRSTPVARVKIPRWTELSDENQNECGKRCVELNSLRDLEAVHSLIVQ